MRIPVRLALAAAATLAAAALPAVALAGGAVTAPVVGPTWAGYDAIAAAPAPGVQPHFTRVTGAWTLPRAACSGGLPAQASVWIGLGGALQTTAVYGPLQIGTDSDCRGGRAVYFAWYEAYPEPLRRLSLAVHAGDALAAVVSIDAAGRPVMSLVDETTGVSATKALRGVHVRPLATDSAEWIVEGPSQRSPVLTDFASVTFTGAGATQASAGAIHTGAVDDPAWGYTEPDVLGQEPASAHQSSVQRSAAPGPLDAAGDGFTVNFDAASAQ